MDTSVNNLAPTGRISAELPCVKCGFILRGLSISGRCPECGEPIRTTLGSTVLRDPDYARRGLEDLGASVKFAIPAFLGLVSWPILGPLVAVLVVATCYLRVSALERLRSGGALDSPALRPSLQISRMLAWVSALFGSLVTLCILHDAFGRWGQWLSPRWAISLAWMWTFILWGEVVLATVFLRRAAIILEVGWLRHAARIFGGLVIGGVGAAIVVMILGSAVSLSNGGRIALLVALIMLSWIPLVVGGWVVGACIQQVAGVAPELHWLASSGHGLVQNDGETDAPAATVARADSDSAHAASRQPAGAIGTAAGTDRHRSDDDPIPLD